MTMCVDCLYLKTKDTKKSKIPYGYCEKLKMNLIAVQIDCKHHDAEKGVI